MDIDVPVFEENIDLSSPTDGAKTFLTMVLSVVILLAAFALGRNVFNSAAERTAHAETVEVFG